MYYFIYQNSEHFFPSKSTTILTSFLRLFLFHVNAFAAWITLTTLFHVLLLNLYIGVIMTVNAIIRMDQIDILLKKGYTKKEKTFKLTSSESVTQLHGIVVKNLSYVCIANNRLFRKIFFIFIVINVPINLRLLVLSVFAEGTVIQRLFLLAFIVGQMIGIFGKKNAFK